jgi:hypothetical protein
MTTTQASDVELPGITHALGVLQKSKLSPDQALVLLTLGTLAERDLRTGNGYNGHSILEIGLALNGALSGRDVAETVSVLVAHHELTVSDPGVGYTRARFAQAMQDPELGSRFGDAHAAILSGGVVVRIPETIEVAR